MEAASDFFTNYRNTSISQSDDLRVDVSNDREDNIPSSDNQPHSNTNKHSNSWSIHGMAKVYKKIKGLGISVKD